MRKLISVWMCVVLMAISFFTGCGKQEEASADSDGGNGAGTEITLMNIKTEVNDQIEALAAAYQAETGVKVNIVVAGNTIDGQALLKGFYLSDQMPDIIACESSGFSNWEGLLVDMSDQAWASKTSAAFIDKNYGTIGFPYTTEAIGLAYNADILQKCGVDPDAITGPDSLKAAIDTVAAHKDELGLTSVVDMCLEPEGVGWSSGNHLFGTYIDSGLARDDTTYLDGIKEAHQVDADRFANYTEMISWFVQNTDRELMLAGTYDEQISTFASGKAAFITQGSWIGASLTASEDYKNAGSFQVGMIPYAFDDGINTILTSAPSWWAIPKEANVEAAEAFLQWCSEDAGQKILVEQAGFVSPFTDCKYVAADPFATVISKYLGEGRTSNWHWMELPSGIGSNPGGLCYCFYRFASGEEDASGFMDDINETLATWYAKQ